MIGRTGEAVEEDAARGAGVADRILERLVERRETVAAAESLTGGLVAAELTAAPGASRAFLGSVTAYVTEVKRALLGVSGPLLAARGAVDAEVARQMAAGVREVVGTDWGVATTGVAGPSEQDGQPVGRVYVAVAGPDGTGEPTARELDLSGDRAAIRGAAVQAVLQLLLGKLGDISETQNTEQRGGKVVCSPE